MELVVVERILDQPYTEEDLRALESRSATCLELHQVKRVKSYLSRDRSRLICIYSAPDAEAVRHANRMAGFGFESIWTADAF